MTRQSVPISTIQPGDQVIIKLRGRAIDTIHTWAGEVLAVDAVAIRLKTAWYRLALSIGYAEDVRIIPWSRVDIVMLAEVG